jgi:hypothetical protein
MIPKKSFSCNFEANTCLSELASLSAHYNPVRKHAVGLIGKDSISIFEQIINRETDTSIGRTPQQRPVALKNDTA